jgi:hypothetical protein
MKLDVKTKKRKGYRVMPSKLVFTAECVSDEALLHAIILRMRPESRALTAAIRETTSIHVSDVSDILRDAKEPANG